MNIVVFPAQLWRLTRARKFSAKRGNKTVGAQWLTILFFWVENVFLEKQIKITHSTTEHSQENAKSFWLQPNLQISCNGGTNLSFFNNLPSHTFCHFKLLSLKLNWNFVLLKSRIINKNCLYLSKRCFSADQIKTQCHNDTV